MALLYSMYETKLSYLHVYDDYVEIKKPYIDNSFTFSNVKRFARVAKAVINPEKQCKINRYYYSDMEGVYFTPATGNLWTGYLQFYIKGANNKQVNMWNVNDLFNAVNFNQKENEKAREIAEFVRGKIR